ncbi:DUF308 domain-containing protein [Niabella sp. CC-SYL272]|uniref:DUF308 domain-containing protein n=1 Tax=Niabella agricola TaxID=2891571 RepID=UPI003872FD23|nr:DUF308 domain-containing protein [Niabella agricola]
MHSTTIKSGINKLPLWIIPLAASLLLIGISFYIFAYPWNSYLQLIKLSGIGILLNGLLLIILYYIEGALFNRSDWMLAEGILNSLFGILMLFNPLLNFFLFAYFSGIWAICWGGLKMIQSLLQKKELKSRYLLSAEGLCAVLIGVLLLNLPFMKTRTIIQWIALLLLLISILNISINLKTTHLKEMRPSFFKPSR